MRAASQEKQFKIGITRKTQKKHSPLNHKKNHKNKTVTSEMLSKTIKTQIYELHNMKW